MTTSGPIFAPSNQFRPERALFMDSNVQALWAFVFPLLLVAAIAEAGIAPDDEIGAVYLRRMAEHMARRQ